MPLVLTPLRDIPHILPGDNLGAIIVAGLEASRIDLEDGDILVIGQKIVSKAEGRIFDLTTVEPGAAAVEVAVQTGKDPRLVELILRESNRVIRSRPGVLIVEHRLGFVCANAGIDHSNVAGPADSSHDFVLLLPADPDLSAGQIRSHLEAWSGKRLGVLINDSHGRPWRLGTVGTCIGLAGMPALIDQRGWSDLFGYKLHATVVGAADELAAGASLIMGQAAEGTPVVHVRGFPYALEEGALEEIIRPAELDLFR